MKRSKRFHLIYKDIVILTFFVSFARFERHYHGKRVNK